MRIPQTPPVSPIFLKSLAIARRKKCYETFGDIKIGNLLLKITYDNLFNSDNTVYLGRSARLGEYLFADGVVLSNRSFSKLVNNESGWKYISEKFGSYGASKCPATASERREWGFYWRERLTRKQQNSGKLRYSWSLHPKVILPPSLPYPRLRLNKLQPALF